MAQIWCEGIMRLPDAPASVVDFDPTSMCGCLGFRIRVRMRLWVFFLLPRDSDDPSHGPISEPKMTFDHLYTDHRKLKKCRIISRNSQSWRGCLLQTMSTVIHKVENFSGSTYAAGAMWRCLPSEAGVLPFYPRKSDYKRAYKCCRD